MGTAIYPTVIAFAAVLFILGLYSLISKPRAKRASLTEHLPPFQHDKSLSDQAEEWLRRQS